MPLRLYEPTDGALRFRDGDITHTGRRGLQPFRREVQFVFQDPVSSLNPRKRVGQIVGTPMRLAGKSRDATATRVRELLEVTRGFHRLVDEAAHTQTLIDMISTATAFDWAFRLKWSVESHQDTASLHRSLEQHRRVAAAIEARDGAAAEEAMRHHTGSRAEAYLAIAAGNTALPG